MNGDYKISEYFRHKVIKNKNLFLISKIAQSDQSKDLLVPPNCNGYGRIRHFKIHKNEYWSLDPLPNIPYATAMNTSIEEVLRAQVFQISACDFRCWFCFVDNNRLSGNKKYASFLSSDELIELYINEPNRPKIIDLSGGQPYLAPEWIHNTIKSIEKYNLVDVYLWTDDNLSNYFYWKFLTLQERRYISEFKNLGKVGCFKGIDQKSFSYNTSAEEKRFKEQFSIFSKYFNEGVDLYAYTIFTSPPFKNVKSSVKLFIDNLQRIHHNLPLRTVPLEIELYSPTLTKIRAVDNLALKFQYNVHLEWKEELSKRFSSNELNLLISNVKMDKNER